MYSRSTAVQQPEPCLPNVHMHVAGNIQVDLSYSCYLHVNREPAGVRSIRVPGSSLFGNFLAICGYHRTKSTKMTESRSLNRRSEHEYRESRPRETYGGELCRRIPPRFLLGSYAHALVAGGRRCPTRKGDLAVAQDSSAKIRFPARWTSSTVWLLLQRSTAVAYSCQTTISNARLFHCPL